jgi:hypothetical protein
MREYSSAELDLMAKAYERAHDSLSDWSSVPLEDLANRSLSLVSGIVEAIDQGERDEELLVFAALSKVALGDRREATTIENHQLRTGANVKLAASGARPRAWRGRRPSRS